MKKVRLLVVMVLVAVVLAACGGLQAKWDKASEEDRAKIILSQSQHSLKTLFVSGQAFVQSNPKYEPDWKEKVLPSLDATNKILGDLIARGKAGERFTVLQVMTVLAGRISEITKTLEAWGVKIAESEWLLQDFKTFAESRGKEVA